MKNLNQINCVALTPQESLQIYGGANKLKTGFWQDLAYIAGIVVHGFVVFGKDGGRNAGLCVK